MSINLISCIDKARGIGSKGSLLTKPPLDFKHFRELTTGGFVVFGKDTFNEIGKPLSGRTNIVLSRNPNIKLPSGVYHYMSVQDILFEYEQYAEKQIDLWICGGEKVYQEFLPFTDYIYLTEVNHQFQHSDRHFPKFSTEEWQVIDTVHNDTTDDYSYDYSFVTYKRKKLENNK